ncbi:MAG: SAP domain-containing protein [Pirellulaceae bacterium]|nr:SAP domain-containing protein [Pirellulaceae bacterium]
MATRTKSAKFTEEEQALIVTDLLTLKKKQIGDFLASAGLAKSGTKEELRERIEVALEDDSLSLQQIVEFLDSVIPWGKQHVYLFKGPASSIANWRKPDWMATLLKKHRLAKYLNANLPLALPDKMKVSSIQHDSRHLRVTAIKRRDWWERDADYDDSSTTEEGEDVELRAFVHRVTRSLVAFEWDLAANTAFLQISQLPTGFDYADVADEFFELIEGWLDRSLFTPCDLRPPITQLHALEESGTGETRSHGIDYRTLQGRRFGGKSASAADPLLGEATIDAALSAIRKSGIGHLGNFYWIPTNGAGPAPCPFESDIHVILVGFKNRINFPTPNDEETVRYVLSRIRSHCA